MTPSIYGTLTAMPDFIRILGNGTCYSKIDEQEISPILRLLDGHEVLEYSGIYVENSTVVVKTGRCREWKELYIEWTSVKTGLKSC
jgi:transcriptional antiterminator NusG